MAKSKERNLAIKLRKNGESVKEIARIIGVSKGSVSIWCRDIKLTTSQIEALEKREELGKIKGRQKGADTNKRKRIERINSFKKEGAEMLKKLSLRDLFIAGVALYWGEGSKNDSRLQMTNSDPRIIIFFILWVEKVFNVPKSELVFYVSVNEMHKRRLPEIERYWQKLLEVDSGQFTKTVILKSKNKKRYSNFEKHYGTMRVTVRKSSRIRYIVQGAIEKMID